MTVRMRGIITGLALTLVVSAPGVASAHPIASGGAKAPYLGITSGWFGPPVNCNPALLPVVDGWDGGIKDVSAHAGTTGVRITVDITNLPTQPSSDAATVSFYTTGCRATGAEILVNRVRSNVTIPSNAKWILIVPQLLARILTSYSVTH